MLHDRKAMHFFCWANTTVRMEHSRGLTTFDNLNRIMKYQLVELKPPLKNDKRDLDIIMECHRNNHPEWGAPLPIDEYLRREQILARMPYTKQEQTAEEFPFRLRFWTLKLYNEDCDDGIIVAHCETYDKPLDIYISRPDSKIDFQRAKAVGVASVFVRKNMRRKGHGKMMMSLLHDVIYKDKNVCASCLYSDVDPFYYNSPPSSSSLSHEWKLDWKPYDSRYIKIYQFEKLLSALNEIPGQGAGISVERIYSFEQIDRLIKHTFDPLVVKDLIRNLCKSWKNSDSKLFTVMRPSVACFEWFYERSEFYAEFFGIKPSNPARSLKGISIKDSSEYVIYFWDWKSKALMVLLHQVSSQQSAFALLKAICEDVIKSNGYEQNERYIEQCQIWGSFQYFDEVISRKPRENCFTGYDYGYSGNSMTEIPRKVWSDLLHSIPDSKKVPETCELRTKIDYLPGVTQQIRLTDSIPSLSVNFANISSSFTADAPEVFWLYNEKYSWI